MKLIKFLFKLILVLIAIPIILIATLPLWLGTIARPAINKVAPSFTGTSFNVGHLHLNPYTGRFELGDLVVGNPEGYDEPTAIAISNLVFDVAMDTLQDKYVHVEDVIVEDLYLSVVKGGEHNVDNLQQIQYNVAGGKKKFEEKLEAKKAKQAEAEKAAKEAPEEEDEEPVLDKKFVIDHVLIRNVKVKYGLLTLPIPTIELRDLGKESDGIDFAGFFEAVWNAILKSAGVLGDLTGQAAGAVGKGVSAAAGAVGDGASKAAGAVSEGATKAVESATKALDSLKELW